MTTREVLDTALRALVLAVTEPPSEETFAVLHPAIDTVTAAILKENEQEARRRRDLRDKFHLADGEVTVRGYVVEGSNATLVDPPESACIEEMEVTLNVADTEFRLFDYSHTDALISAIEVALLNERGVK